jgi:hypothetical protein
MLEADLMTTYQAREAGKNRVNDSAAHRASEARTSEPCFSRSRDPRI